MREEVENFFSHYVLITIFSSSCTFYSRSVDWFLRIYCDPMVVVAVHGGMVGVDLIILNSILLPGSGLL